MGEYIGGEYAPDFLDRVGLIAHFLITPKGDVLQMLNTSKIGAHAKGHNYGTVGTEFLLEGDHDIDSLKAGMKTDYITDDQYYAGVELATFLKGRGLDMLTRHDWLSPERKQDPGTGFPWEQFVKDTGYEKIIDLR